MTSTFESEQIRLRDVTPDDLPLFFEHQQDPVAVAAFRSRDRAAFDQHWAKLLADETILKMSIVVAAAVSADSSPENQIAGNIVSWTSAGKREVGYWIDRAFWGRGVATEALAAFLRLEPIRPLYAGVTKHNLASIRVLQKCGFTVYEFADDPSNPADASHVLLTLTAGSVA